MVNMCSKRFIAMLLTLSIFLGIAPVTAFATGSAYDERVTYEGGTTIYDENGNLVDNWNDGAVKISKTISATNEENVFNITLDVESKNKIIETTEEIGRASCRERV